MNAVTLKEGANAGAVGAWLRAEGQAVLVLSLLLCRHFGASWWMFAALLLIPDLSMLPHLNRQGRKSIQ